MEIKDIKRLLLVIYVIFVIVVGVLAVPFKKVWGPSNELRVYDVVYAPLWSLTDKYHRMDDYTFPIYELQVTRLLFTIFIVSLIFFIIYLLLSTKE
ncbi:hypothetical protein DL346_17195 [Paenibacillus montanisoli]|uniref:Uncharacterized protein n=1 Tax=Paenibacillus montanisoli TaxID=2081970 RepID=A0A328U105_9BACL|nr:hypothetical protein DL346_17195 [Paenibacillus montanisoli]